MTKKAFLGTTRQLAPSQTPEARRAYRQANRERILEQQRQWRLDNPDKVRASAKKWYEKNAESVKSKVVAWNKANPDRRRINQRNARANLTEKRTSQGLNVNTGKPLKSVTGSIYIAECQGRYKIGYSNDVIGRGYDLNTHSPFPVTIIYDSKFITGVNFVETALHKKYADKQVHGEWFTLNKTNVKHIKTAVNKISYANHFTTV